MNINLTLEEVFLLIGAIEEALNDRSLPGSFRQMLEDRSNYLTSAVVEEISKRYAE